MAMSSKVPPSQSRSRLRAVVLAMVPMLLGLAGAAADQWTRLGFSSWRAACREAGLTLGSLLTFTVQLLPTAVAGLLTGGLIVLMAGVIRRHRHDGTVALAAHGGCIVGMTVALPLCVLTPALPLAVPLMIVAEALLTAASAWFLFALLQRPWQVRSRAYIDPQLEIRESGT